jgi:hypothetical protein
VVAVSDAIGIQKTEHHVIAEHPRGRMGSGGSKEVALPASHTQATAAATKSLQDDMVLYEHQKSAAESAYREAYVHSPPFRMFTLPNHCSHWVTAEKMLFSEKLVYVEPADASDCSTLGMFAGFQARTAGNFTKHGAGNR